MMKLAVLALLIILTVPALGTIPEDTKEASNLALRVYVDEVGMGRALVTGYVDNISALHFVKAPNYRYDNHTHLLYAITDSLIQGSNDNWNLRFVVSDNFNEYHMTFYIPASMELTKIDRSEGLDSQVSRSNKSIIVDVQGFEIRDPKIIIGYRRVH